MGVLGSIPKYNILVQVAIHVFHHFFVVTSGGYALQAVTGNSFVDIAGWVHYVIGIWVA